MTRLGKKLPNFGDHYECDDASPRHALSFTSNSIKAHADSFSLHVNFAGPELEAEQLCLILKKTYKSPSSEEEGKRSIIA